MLIAAEIAGPGDWTRAFEARYLDKFTAPTVEDIEFPSLGVSQAWNDRSTGTLHVVTYAAAPEKRGARDAVARDQPAECREPHAPVERPAVHTLCCRRAANDRAHDDHRRAPIRDRHGVQRRWAARRSRAAAAAARRSRRLLARFHRRRDANAESTDDGPRVPVLRIRFRVRTHMTQDALTDLLNLSSPAVAIAFSDTPPAGVGRIACSGPASCDYWRQAAEGRTFYTIADDHKACPIGAHTHHVETSAEEQQQLMGLIENMVELSYIKMEEVPSIPRRPRRYAWRVRSAGIGAGGSGRRARARERTATHVDH